MIGMGDNRNGPRANLGQAGHRMLGAQGIGKYSNMPPPRELGGYGASRGHQRTYSDRGDYRDRREGYNGPRRGGYSSPRGGYEGGGRGGYGSNSYGSPYEMGGSPYQYGGSSYAGGGGHWQQAQRQQQSAYQMNQQRYPSPGPHPYEAFVRGGRPMQGGYPPQSQRRDFKRPSAADYF